MREAKWTMQEEKTGQLTQVVVGIILLVLLIGLWACLWVPPFAF